MPLDLRFRPGWKIVLLLVHGRVARLSIQFLGPTVPVCVPGRDFFSIWSHVGGRRCELVSDMRPMHLFSPSQVVNN